MRTILWVAIAVFMSVALALAQPSHSLYAGQEKRAMKALSEEEIQALLSGQGMGVAKAAELNHYPGPRHVLDLATHLQLSEMQRAETQRLYDRMHQDAVRLGTFVVDKERALEHLFATEAVDAQTLQHLAKQIAQLQGDLRLAHLQAHVEMKRVLSRSKSTPMTRSGGIRSGQTLHRTPSISVISIEAGVTSYPNRCDMPDRQL